MTATRIEPCMPTLEASWAEDCWRDVVDAQHRIGDDPRIVAVEDALWSHRIEGIEAKAEDVVKVLFGGDEASDDATRMAANHARTVLLLDDLRKEWAIGNPLSQTFLLSLHTELFRGVSRETLMLSPGTVMSPGTFRRLEGEGVMIGSHVAPEGPDVDALMRHIENRFRIQCEFGKKADLLVAVAASHHRLLHIHPFLDGNGRVARLAAVAMAMKAGLAAGTKWSLSRALAEPHASSYYDMLAHADMPRQGDLDGRGNLSERALTAFCQWMTSAIKHEAERRAAPTPVPES